MNNYIMFEGQKIPLTDEQIKMFKLCADKKKSLFERVECNQRYYFIDIGGTVSEIDDDDAVFDNKCFNTANYCTDKELMEQRALHETLSRLLWRFSAENSHPEIAACTRYEICFELTTAGITADTRFVGKSRTIGGCSFATKELACRAIEEIVKPFIKEHPDFVW